MNIKVAVTDNDNDIDNEDDNDDDVNPLGPRILFKHATMFPGFLANFERFYFLVFKNL